MMPLCCLFVVHRLLIRDLRLVEDYGIDPMLIVVTVLKYQ